MVRSIAVSGDAVVASTGSGMYRSTDDGLTWLPANSGLADSAATGEMAVAGTRVFAAAGKGLYRSEDQGGSWVKAVASLNASGGIRSLAVAGSALYAGTNSGVYRSPDNGDSWTDVTGGLPAPGITAMTVSGDNLYVGLWSQGIWKRSLEHLASPVRKTARNLPARGGAMTGTGRGARMLYARPYPSSRPSASARETGARDALGKYTDLKPRPRPSEVLK